MTTKPAFAVKAELPPPPPPPAAGGVVGVVVHKVQLRWSRLLGGHARSPDGCGSPRLEPGCRPEVSAALVVVLGGHTRSSSSCFSQLSEPALLTPSVGVPCVYARSVQALE